VAFDRLKQALASPQILALENDHDILILDTDAAEGSIGCVLSQLQNDKEKVIAYAGRSLNRNEINYCITRKELLAIVHFTKHFRQYLLGRPFVIRTDHTALSWLKKTPQPIGQNARWLELLGEYDFIIKHRPGPRHGNADAISRHPCLNKSSCTACHGAELRCVAITAISHLQQDGSTSECTSPQQGDNAPLSKNLQTIISVSVGDGPADRIGWTAEELTTAQRQDTKISHIIRLMDNDPAKPAWKEMELQSSDVKSLWHEWERLGLRNNVLCRKWISIDNSPDQWQVVLPRSHRKELIRMAHTGMTGHLGRSKTEGQVRRRAYLTNWRSQVASELKRCVECAQYHRGKTPKQTPLQPFAAGEPFEVVAVDITGKHPKSSRGNEYIVTVTDIFSK